MRNAGLALEINTAEAIAVRHRQGRGGAGAQILCRRLSAPSIATSDPPLSNVGTSQRS